MCGICGWIRPSGVRLAALVRMNRRASHRGPDGEGYWLWDGKSATGQFIASEAAAGHLHQQGMIGLGHRRLAILDLTDAGLRPMPSKQWRLWLRFNRPVYDSVELRRLRQPGHQFTVTPGLILRSSWLPTDRGTKCFARFNGMWGIAIIDLQDNPVLSRDRLGIKPLYVWLKTDARVYLRGIEQFFALPDITPAANMDAIVEYIDTGHECPPATFFEDIHAFPPGHWGEISIDQPEYPQPQPFWFPEEICEQPRSVGKRPRRANPRFI